MNQKSGKKKKPLVTAVVANQTGEIFDLEGYAAVGMNGPSLVPLTLDETSNDTKTSSTETASVHRICRNEFIHNFLVCLKI